MKKHILLAFAVLLCSIIQANQPEKIGILSAKAILSETDGYYVFSDNTCWKVFSFSKRRRSLKEWWNNVQLAPEIFECAPNNWNVGTEIEVYPKAEFLGIPEENASNKIIIKNCSHVFVNAQTKQVLFGNALGTTDCIVQLFAESYQTGYDNGYTNGYAAGYSYGYVMGDLQGYNRGRLISYPKSATSMSKKRLLKKQSNKAASSKMKRKHARKTLKKQIEAVK